MMRTLLAISTAVLLAHAAPAVHPVAAQSSDDCSAYFAAAKGGASGAVPIIPDGLLVNTRTSIECLIKVIAGLKDSAQTTSLNPAVRTQFLSATGALRAIISKINSDDEKAGGQRKGIDNFIKTFRDSDSLEVISVLAYGVRSNSYEVRSNSLLLLANVIDNSTLCVPLDHLWDPTLGEEDYSIRGRANLLAVISVVAPWAYRENFDNIERIQKHIGGRIDRTNPDLKQTVDILSNIETRLKSQTEKTNKMVTLSPELKKDCVAYKRQWATQDQLKY